MNLRSLIFPFFVFLLMTKSICASEAIRYFDIKYYDPANYDLKDLYFEVQVPGLAEKLNERMSYGKIENVYYEVFWLTHDKFKIKVKGLPEGFKKLRNELKSLVYNRIDYVLPQKLAPKLEGYTIEEKKIKGGEKFVKAIDETHEKNINKIHLKFDSDGKLREFKTFSPSGTQIARMSYKKYPWSHEKWVADEIKVKSLLGVQKSTINHKISYQKISKYGLPKKIKFVTRQELVGNQGDGEETPQREIETTLLFNQYKINQGIAKKEILKSPSSD